MKKCSKNKKKNYRN